jgi:transketolase
MRNAFARVITRLAAEDPRIVLLSGDIGNRLFNPYKEANGDRFFNCGVAEANMIGVASGLALSGLRPVTYTIASFSTTRCFEQIRVDLCYQNAPVLVVGTGSGLSYASLGGTHHSCEDIAILRSLPGMTVLCPADIYEIEALLPLALQLDGPAYMRIGKKNEPNVHESVPTLTIGKAHVLRPGGDRVCLLGTGNTLPMACDIRNALAAHGVDAEVVSMHTVKPLDQDFLEAACERFTLLATLEEHTSMGGFGSAVAEFLVDRDQAPRARLRRYALADRFLHQTGGQEIARKRGGLDPSAISADLLRRLS